MGYMKKVKEVARQKKRVEKPVWKKYIIGLAILSFISVWMFALGVMVGRDDLPVRFDIEKLQTELAALKEAVLEEDQKRYRVLPQTADNQQKLDFYEALKDARDTYTDLKKSPKKQSTVPVLIPQTTPPPQKKKTTDTAPNRKKRISIQVASFKDPLEASRMVQKLKQRGYPAYRAIGKIPGRGIWYRVRIGDYQSRSETRGMLSRLKQDRIKGIVVQR